MALAKNSKVKRAGGRTKMTFFPAPLSAFLVAPGGDGGETLLLGNFPARILQKLGSEAAPHKLEPSPSVELGKRQTSKRTGSVERVTSAGHPRRPRRTRRGVGAHLLQQLSVSLRGLLDELPHRPPFLAGHHHACLPERHRHLHHGAIHFIQDAGPRETPGENSAGLQRGSKTEGRHQTGALGRQKRKKRKIGSNVRAGRGLST